MVPLLIRIKGTGGGTIVEGEGTTDKMLLTTVNDGTGNVTEDEIDRQGRKVLNGKNVIERIPN